MRSAPIRCGWQPDQSRSSQLHDQRAIRAVDRLGSGRSAAAIERRATSEGDRIGDQLRAVRTPGRRAAGITDGASGEIDGTGDVLSAAPLDGWVAAVVVVAVT